MGEFIFFSIFTLRKKMAKLNVLVGNRYSTFSTEFDDFFITSIGGDTQTATVYSLISSSLQLGVANKKSMQMIKSYLRSMLLMPTLS